MVKRRHRAHSHSRIMWTRCEPRTPRTRYKVALQCCLCRFLGLLTHTQAELSGTVLGPDARARRAPREALGRGRGARGPVESETEEAVAAGQFGGDLGGLIGRRSEVAPDLPLAGKAIELTSTSASPSSGSLPKVWWSCSRLARQGAGSLPYTVALKVVVLGAT